MGKGNWVLLGSATLLASSILLAPAHTAAAPEPATQPAGSGRHHKLPEPYSSLKTLTPEQSDKILSIHADSLVQENKIRDKEADDITAILTPAQVAELKSMKEKAKEEQKELRKKIKAAATEPTK